MLSWLGDETIATHLSMDDDALSFAVMLAPSSKFLIGPLPETSDDTPGFPRPWTWRWVSTHKNHLSM